MVDVALVVEEATRGVAGREVDAGAGLDRSIFSSSPKDSSSSSAFAVASLGAAGAGFELDLEVVLGAGSTLRESRSARRSSAVLRAMMGSFLATDLERADMLNSSCEIVVKCTRQQNNGDELLHEAAARCGVRGRAGRSSRDLGITNHDYYFRKTMRRNIKIY